MKSLKPWVKPICCIIAIAAIYGVAHWNEHRIYRKIFASYEESIIGTYRVSKDYVVKNHYIEFLPGGELRAFGDWPERRGTWGFRDRERDFFDSPWNFEPDKLWHRLDRIRVGPMSWYDRYYHDLSLDSPHLSGEAGLYLKRVDPGKGRN